MININFKPSKKQYEAWKYLNDKETLYVGYGGAAFCFEGNTLVNTNKGYKKIKDIKKGDFVLSENIINNSLEYRVVEKTYKNSSEIERKFVTLHFNNGTKIKSTYNHEYRFKGDWLPASSIARRVVALCSEHKQTLSDKQQREIVNNWIQGEQKDFTYEASEGQLWVHEDQYNRKWQDTPDKNTQISSNCIHSKPNEEARSKSFRFQYIKQLRNEFRMVYKGRKYEVFKRCRASSMEQYSTTLKTRFRKWFGNIKRVSSNRNKTEIQASSLHQKDVSKGVWSIGSDNKRYCTPKKLEAFEVDLNDIAKIEFTTEFIETYDLKVEFNENYVVSENNIKVHNSGKSYLLCYWLTTMCIGYPETSWGLGRRALNNLKKTTLVTLFKVFAECGIEKEKHYKYNQQDNIITFFNGSIIYLLDTANNPSDPLFTRFGGLELTGAAIDESAETDYEAVKILFTRLGRKNNDKYGLKKKLLETFNPAKNHVYSRYYKPHKEGNELSRHHFIPALPKDNPAPEVEDYINDILATSDEVTIQRLIYGNFEYDDDPATLIGTKEIYNIFTNNTLKGGLKAITCDVARFGKDASIIMLWNGYRVEKIIKIDKNSLPELANEIKSIARSNGVQYCNIVIDENGVGGGVVDLIPECRGFINNSKALNDENYNNLKSQCYYKLAEKINKQELFIYESPFKNEIVEELEQVKRKNMDADGKMQVVPKDEVKKLLGRSPDFSDTLMMRILLDLSQPIKFTGSMSSFFGL